MNVNDAGGVYNGSSFPAMATVSGVGGTAGSSLEGASPSLAYYSGTYNSSAQLAGLTALPGAPTQAGAYTVLASFPATADYAAATGLANFTVSQATPQVNWTAPGSIVFGTPLSAAQLDASAGVPGTFTYKPAAGAILGAGAGQALTATFTPTDSTDYATVDATTTITVTPATPALSLSAPGGTFDGSPFAASVTIAGTGNQNTPAATLEDVAPVLTYYVGTGTSGTNLGSTPPIDPGTYTVVAYFPGSADYAATPASSATFSIGKSAPQIALSPSSGSAVFGQAVTLVAGVSFGAATPGGSVTFYDGSTPLGTVPIGASAPPR